MNKIAFGTSGWRGILAEDFTMENVRLVTQAIADHLKENHKLGGVVIGYDSRFMGEKFAEEAAKVLAGAGIVSFLCDRDTPTPVIAYEIMQRNAAGGINFTASHNPPDYNGLKFSSETGGPALPDVTSDISRRANEMMGELVYREVEVDIAQKSGLIQYIDPRASYTERLKELIDFKAIASAGFKIGVNPMYGTGRDYLDTVLKQAGIPVVTINDHRDPYFGGFPPEPAAENIEDFRSLVQQDSTMLLGLATDGDADRYGILDSDGTCIEPNYILALLYDYMIRVRGEKGFTARSVATSHLLDAVAAYHGQQVYETPVGFKYIGEMITEGSILIGGEESAGLTIRGHVPDKDGILACLLVAEMVAKEGKTLQVLLQELYVRVGVFRTRRVNLRLSLAEEDALDGKLQSPPESIGGFKIEQLITIDGTKFVFGDGAWILMRKSGTEPVVRLYGEASSDERLDELIAAGSEFVCGG